MTVRTWRIRATLVLDNVARARHNDGMETTAETVIAENIGGDDWLVMWDDGSVREFRGRDTAEKAIKRAAENRVASGEALVTRIEWRP